MTMFPQKKREHRRVILASCVRIQSTGAEKVWWRKPGVAAHFLLAVGEKTMAAGVWFSSRELCASALYQGAQQFFGAVHI